MSSNNQQFRVWGLDLSLFFCLLSIYLLCVLWFCLKRGSYVLRFRSFKNRLCSNLSVYIKSETFEGCIKALDLELSKNKLIVNPLTFTGEENDSKVFKVKQEDPKTLLPTFIVFSFVVVIAHLFFCLWKSVVVLLFAFSSLIPKITCSSISLLSFSFSLSTCLLCLPPVCVLPYRPGAPSLLCRCLASHLRLTGPVLPVVLRRLGPNHQPALGRGLARCRLLHHGCWWGLNLLSHSASKYLTVPLSMKCFTVVAGGSSGAGGTPGEGYEGTVGSYLQQHQTHFTLQQHNQLQQLQQLHHYQQQQLLQYQQQASSTKTVHLCSVSLTTLSDQHIYTRILEYWSVCI